MKNLILGPFGFFFPQYQNNNFVKICFTHFSTLKFIRNYFDNFLPKNPSAIFFPKKSFESTLSLYAAVTTSKKLEKFHAFTFHKTFKNFIWGQFRANFGAKTSKQSFSCSMLRIYAAETPCKNKKSSIHRLLTMPEKHLLAQKLQNKVILPKEWFVSTAVTSCKILEKLYALNFDNTWKTSIWATFGPNTSRQSYAPKTMIWVNFRSLCCCNFMKKIKKTPRTDFG